MMLPMLFALALVLVFSFLQLVSSWTCQNVCGEIPIMYPFGTGRGCGSHVFENFVNCTKGKLQLFTPTGQYDVQSIDYTNNMIIIQDWRMSTCNSMQSSASFGLPVGAPFSLVGDTIVLLGCSSTSSVYNSLSALCDPYGTQICQALYGCSSVSQIGLPVNGPTSSCCVYSNAQLTSPPYEIDLGLLQCTSYTSIYRFGPQTSYGETPSISNNQNPSSWSYGIALKYYYDQSTYMASCEACQQSDGVCAFNIYGFVCVCSAGINTTSRCFGMTSVSTSDGTRNYNPLQLLVTVVATSLRSLRSSTS